MKSHERPFHPNLKIKKHYNMAIRPQLKVRLQLLHSKASITPTKYELLSYYAPVQFL